MPSDDRLDSYVGQKIHADPVQKVLTNSLRSSRSKNIPRKSLEVPLGKNPNPNFRGKRFFYFFHGIYLKFGRKFPEILNMEFQMKFF